MQIARSLFFLVIAVSLFSRPAPLSLRRGRGEN